MKKSASSTSTKSSFSHQQDSCSLLGKVSLVEKDDKRAAFGSFAGYCYSQLIGRNGENLSNLIADHNAGLQPRFASRLRGQGLTSTSSLMLSKLSALTFLMSSMEL
jgi:hypothetical protein